MQKRLVIFAEGDADAAALPSLLARLFTDQFQDDWHGHLFIDPDILRVRGLDSYGMRTAVDYVRYVRIALSRRDFGGLLIVLDADSVRSTCLRNDLILIANYLKPTGAGAVFPAAIVLLQQEYESLFLGSYQSLEQRKDDSELPNPIESHRGCKEWLNKNLKGGYAPIPHQAELTRQLSLDLLKAANIRSFKRLQHALEELYHAMKENQSLLSPNLPT